MQAKDHPAAEVYVRQRWSDDWQHVPYLYADDVVFTTGGQIATARLSWRYGVGWQPDDGEFRTYTRQELADWFVAVVIPQSTEGAPSVIWYGVVVDEVDLRDGHVCNDYYPTLQTNTEPSGQQTLVCYGLELLLERTLVVDSDVLSTVAGGEPVEVTVDEGLTFNQMIFEPASASFRFDNYARNRSPEPAADGVYLFADVPPEVGEDGRFEGVWSTKKILEYLVARRMPRDKDGNDLVRWRLSERAARVLPDWDQPELATHNRSLLSLLEELCARQRGYSWRLAFRGDPSLGERSIVEIDAFTFNPEPFVLTDRDGDATDDVLEANDQQVAIDPDSSLDVDLSLKTSAVDRVDQVIVRAAPVEVVCTLAYLDGTLTRFWALDDQQWYGEPGDLSGYDVDERERIAAERRAPYVEAGVYARFALAASWAGKVGNGTGPGIGLNDLTLEEEDGLSLFELSTLGLEEVEPVDAFPLDDRGRRPSLYYPSLRFQSEINWTFRYATDPSLHGGDFTPFAMFRLPKTDPDDQEEAPRYTLADRLGATAGCEQTGDGSGRDWSTGLKVADDFPAVVVDVNGAPQHVIADASFTPIADVDEAPQFDWQTDMLVTLSMISSMRTEARHPKDEDLEVDTELIRRRVIDFDWGPDCWITKHTVVGVDDDGALVYPTLTDQQREAGGKWLWDGGSQTAFRIAQLAFQWYSIPRRAFDFTMRQISAIVETGQLITTIGAEPNRITANAVVTSVQFDLVNGVTTWQTGFAELDVYQAMAASRPK